MKKLILLLVFIILMPLQNGLKAQDNDILLTIGNNQITANEFLRIYKKNQQNLNSGKQADMEEYLDLFINFKLKVTEAKHMGLDTLPSIREEINKYKEELAKPYLTDEETMNRLLHEAYKRSQIEVKTSHILIKTPQPSSYTDTAYVYEKILNIKNRIIKKNEPFQEVARATSDDPSVKSNGGNLGYFTALQMVYPFETAAYELNTNEISKPIRTKYGYHLIKKTGERKARGKVKVAHIMRLAPKSMPEEKRQQEKEKINEIYHKIKRGEDFNELARKFSQDKSSAQNGGELPWFGIGKMVPEFEQAAFDLEKKGEISKPVKTSVGWHIIKLLDNKTPGTFQEEKNNLKRKLTNSPRYQIARDSLVSRLKSAYNFTGRRENFHVLYRFVNEEKTKVNWNQLKNYPYNDTLFVFVNKLFNTNDFIQYLNQQLPQELNKNYEGQYLLDKAYNRFIEDKIIAYERERLPEKYPEYKYIVREYIDGILLFEIMDRKVWSKASQDTTGLRKYYNNHKTQYMTGERFSGKIYQCADKKNLKKVKKLKKGGLFRKKHSDDEVLKKINQQEKQLEIKEGTYRKGENEIIDHYAWSIGNKEKLQNKKPYWVKGKIIPPKPKKLEQTRGAVMADYQNYLEEQWLTNLKEKYSIQLNEEVFEEIKKQ